MRKRLSRLAPIIILGVTAWLLAACGDSEVVAEPAPETPTPTVVAVTVPPTVPPTPPPTPESQQTPTRQTPTASPQNRTATPLPTAPV
ncbi:MAG: hypothetical protein OXP08_09985, partial [bacterium]|nr:hypothetical protein [bacterium]